MHAILMLKGTTEGWTAPKTVEIKEVKPQHGPSYFLISHDGQWRRVWKRETVRQEGNRKVTRHEHFVRINRHEINLTIVQDF